MSRCPFARSHEPGAHAVSTRGHGLGQHAEDHSWAALLGGNEPTALRLYPQVSIAFQDLAVQFSKDEWRLLGEGQRALYLDVMRENYDTLASLGEERAGGRRRSTSRAQSRLGAQAARGASVFVHSARWCPRAGAELGWGESLGSFMPLLLWAVPRVWVRFGGGAKELAQWHWSWRF